MRPGTAATAIRTMAAYAAMRACVAGVMPASSSAAAPVCAAPRAACGSVGGAGIACASVRATGLQCEASVNHAVSLVLLGPRAATFCGGEQRARISAIATQWNPMSKQC